MKQNGLYQLLHFCELRINNDHALGVVELYLVVERANKCAALLVHLQAVISAPCPGGRPVEHKHATALPLLDREYDFWMSADGGGRRGHAVTLRDASGTEHVRATSRLTNPIGPM